MPQPESPGSQGSGKGKDEPRGPNPAGHVPGQPAPGERQDVNRQRFIEKHGREPGPDESTEPDPDDQPHPDQTLPGDLE